MSGSFFCEFKIPLVLLLRSLIPSLIYACFIFKDVPVITSGTAFGVLPFTLSLRHRNMSIPRPRVCLVSGHYKFTLAVDQWESRI